MLTPIILALLSVVQAGSLVSTGSTLMFNGIPYYIPADPVATLEVTSHLLKSLPSAAGLIPLTVISTPSLSFAQADLDAAVAIFTVADDVFQGGFVEGKSSSFTHALPFLVVEFMSIHGDMCGFLTQVYQMRERTPIVSRLEVD